MQIGREDFLFPVESDQVGCFERLWAHIGWHIIFSDWKNLWPIVTAEGRQVLRLADPELVLHKAVCIVGVESVVSLDSAVVREDSIGPVDDAVFAESRVDHGYFSDSNRHARSHSLERRVAKAEAKSPVLALLLDKKLIHTVFDHEAFLVEDHQVGLPITRDCQCEVKPLTRAENLIQTHDESLGTGHFAEEVQVARRKAPDALCQVKKLEHLLIGFRCVALLCGRVFEPELDCVVQGFTSLV